MSGLGDGPVKQNVRMGFVKIVGSSREHELEDLEIDNMGDNHRAQTRRVKNDDILTHRK